MRHLQQHNLTFKEYRVMFPDALAFPRSRSKKLSHWNKTWIRSDKTRQKMGTKASDRIKRNGNPSSRPEVRKRISASVRKSFENPDRRMQNRVAMIHQINLGANEYANFNPTACEYFDWLNKFMGWNGQYATNGGEKEVRGYFLDYYEPSLNLVIEWDEPGHYVRGVLREKDIRRQQEIIKELKCEFYRYNQRTNIIERVT